MRIFIISRLIICQILLFLASSQFGFAQSYEELLKNYDSKSQNDESAFPYLRMFINKAKKEKNAEKLIQGYKDAIFFSRSIDSKLHFADSAVVVAEDFRDKDLITNAYLGKGIVYYSNFKNYNAALEEYLKAFEFSKNSKNEYLKHKVTYHLGVVKSYLGYYSEALEHFSNCILFFSNQQNLNLSENEKYNNTRGYLNSLAQASNCLIKLEKFTEAEKLNRRGLTFVNAQDFVNENMQLSLNQAIIDFKRGNYNVSLQALKKVSSFFIKKGDFTSEAVVYYYKANIFQKQNENEKALLYYRKVDSVFQKNEFILPELRTNYEILIDYYHHENNVANELYYTKALLRADSIIAKDFTYLSSRIHKEYDTQKLVDIKSNLEIKNRMGLGTIFLLLIGIIVLLFVHWKYRQVVKTTKAKYIELEQNLLKRHAEKANQTGQIIKNNALLEAKITISDELKQQLIAKLNNFEKKESFLEKGLTVSKLAKRFKTNASYLSQIINEQKGQNFNKYIGSLRITYITNLLYFDKRYLQYTVESLAESCGIASRQNFSDLFYEINGMRPKDFINIRRKEIDSKQKEIVTKKPTSILVGFQTT